MNVVLSNQCPQCGKGFAEKLIINLYAPENMLEGCCSPEVLVLSSIVHLYIDVLSSF
jgi:hypothetical protein